VEIGSTLDADLNRVTASAFSWHPADRDFVAWVSFYRY
jgi:hypothetical protein